MVVAATATRGATQGHSALTLQKSAAHVRPCVLAGCPRARARAQLTEILGCGGTMLRLVKSSAYMHYRCIYALEHTYALGRGQNCIKVYIRGLARYAL